MRLTLGRVSVAAVLVIAIGAIPYCSQSRVDQALVDKADRDAADARKAAQSAAESAAQAVSAAKDAQRKAADLEAVDGPGS